MQFHAMFNIFILIFDMFFCLEHNVGWAISRFSLLHFDGFSRLYRTVGGELDMTGSKHQFN
jgi:hypothetical protein